MKYAGIDNGKSGAIAIISNNIILEVFKYPVNEPKSIYYFLQKHNDIKLTAIEQSFMSTMFAGATASGYECQGRYLMCLDLLDIKYTMASPRVKGWRHKLGFTSKGRQNLKQESIDKCLSLFNNAKDYIVYEARKRVDHKLVNIEQYDDNIADSILLAYYAQLFDTGMIKGK